MISTCHFGGGCFLGVGFVREKYKKSLSLPWPKKSYYLNNGTGNNIKILEHILHMPMRVSPATHINDEIRLFGVGRGGMRCTFPQR